MKFDIKIKEIHPKEVFPFLIRVHTLTLNVTEYFHIKKSNRCSIIVLLHKNPVKDEIKLPRTDDASKLIIKV